MNTNTERSIATDTKWIAEPSGLKTGNLDRWKARMANICPNPKRGDLVAATNEKGKNARWYKVIGFKNGVTIWQRGKVVSDNEIYDYGY